MKNRLIGRGIFFTVFVSLGLVFTGCPADTAMSWNQGSPGNPDSPDNPNNFILVTYDIILTNLYDELIKRVTGETSTPDLGILLEGEGQGNIMGQTANCQYICDAISVYANKNFQPASGTGIQMANMEYLLKMIDKANGDSTSYGTGPYATQQFVDTAAVTQALSLIIMFKTQTWSAPGSYQIELPAGTYTMTAVSGKGGNGGSGGDTVGTLSGNIRTNGNNGVLGNKTILNFTITSSIIVTVIVGNNGGNGGNGEANFRKDGAGGSGGSGGNPGNGGNGYPGIIGYDVSIGGDGGGGGGGGGGASGINNYYYVRGGSGGAGGNGFLQGVPYINGEGGAGGNGGSLTGTATNGTATTEAPFVKLDRT